MPHEDRSRLERQPRGAVTSAPTTDPVAGEASGWTVLADAGLVPKPDRPVSWRRIVVQSVLATIAVFSVVAGAGTFAPRRAAELESVNDALDATGYLLKDADPRELVAAVGSAARGEAPLDPRVARALLPGGHPVLPPEPPDAEGRAAQRSRAPGAAAGRPGQDGQGPPRQRLPPDRGQRPHVRRAVGQGTPPGRTAAPRAPNRVVEPVHSPRRRARPEALKQALIPRS
ncbi:MAG: hypothetical protein QOJ50_1503 [Cryptosporangiaceae bacterium]|nr:hypothetical protein [Cryptosporangiaceae bacterium]